jgi:Zn-dependent protease
MSAIGVRVPVFHPVNINELLGIAIDQARALLDARKYGSGERFGDDAQHAPLAFDLHGLAGFENPVEDVVDIFAQAGSSDSHTHKHSVRTIISISTYATSLLYWGCVNPDQLAFGFLQYVVFLLSTTCHEAAHSFVALSGGDKTAFEGGQVTLNPVPHIRREPFGMVVMPLLGITTGSGLIGWASAPYDPLWSSRYPKRAAWMSLAGPATNFLIAALAGIAMRVGVAMGVFTRGATSTSHIVGALSSGIPDGIATILSVFFSLNILLGCFNLLPFPPLDGYGVLGLFTSERMAIRLQEWRVQFRAFAIIGLILGWRMIDTVYFPMLRTALKIFGLTVEI